jgi:hypothetical protein
MCLRAALGEIMPIQRFGPRGTDVHALNERRAGGQVSGIGVLREATVAANRDEPTRWRPVTVAPDAA